MYAQMPTPSAMKLTEMSVAPVLLADAISDGHQARASI
jgi:hypothetical protein